MSLNPSSMKKWIRSAAAIWIGFGSTLALSAQEQEKKPGTHKVEWQKSGAALKKSLDMYALKDSDGLVIVWNRSKPYFKMKVIGKETKGTAEGESAYFMVDGVFLQVLSLETDQFIKKTVGLSNEQILEAHRDWEFDYMKHLIGAGASVKSWPSKLPDGTPVLYWEAIPEVIEEGKPSKHVMVTRYRDGAVICVTSVESKSNPLDRAKALIFDAISHIDFLDKRLEAKTLQREILKNAQ